MNTDKKNVRLLRGLLVVVSLFLLFPAFLSAGETYEVSGTESGFVTTADGVRIHYLEAGAETLRIGEQSGKPNVKFRPTLLFIPGWTMPAWVWEHQINYFSKHYRVVAMDPRSQGQSSDSTEGHHPAARARDIKAVVDQLGLAPVVLVGWSMGVTEAVAYVDQFGADDLAALVLVDGIVGGEYDPELTPQMFQWAHSFQLDRRKATDTFVREMYANPEVQSDEEYLQRVIAASLRTPTNSAMALLMGSFTTDLRPALAKIDRPTLIVVAQSPWMKYYEELHRLAPGSQMEVFENVGHALFVDKADEFNALVEEFLAGATTGELAKE